MNPVQRFTRTGGGAGGLQQPSSCRARYRVLSSYCPVPHHRYSRCHSSCAADDCAAEVLSRTAADWSGSSNSAEQEVTRIFSTKQPRPEGKGGSNFQSPRLSEPHTSASLSLLLRDNQSNIDMTHVKALTIKENCISTLAGEGHRHCQCASAAMAPD